MIDVTSEVSETLSGLSCTRHPGGTFTRLADKHFNLSCDENSRCLVWSGDREQVSVTTD